MPTVLAQFINDERQSFFLSPIWSTATHLCFASAVRVNKSVFKTTLQLYEDLSKGGGGEKI